jgi:hypothetical protein
MRFKVTIILFSFIVPLFFLGVFGFFPSSAFSASDASEEKDDQELYLDYQGYLRYQKYKDYKEAKEKYGFKTTQIKNDYKNKYSLYKANPKKYASYYDAYKRYKNYKNKYSEKYAGYDQYKKYYDKGWKYQKYGKKKYKDGYNRYQLALKNKTTGGTIASGSTGPEITVGILKYEKNYSKDHAFRFRANKDYAVKDSAGNSIALVSSSKETSVKYVSSSKLRVYGEGFDTEVNEQVDFVALDGNNDDLIFNVDPNPKYSFDDYRGKIRVRYSNDSSQVWVINMLPLEQYAWGMGEITGTGAMEYNKVMSLTFRTYGYWKIKYSTRYTEEGFKVDATANSQIYYGYDWELDHPRIKEAVQATRGQIVKYKDRIAITPYSSSTDGRTRSWKERWGSDNYPWCVSVEDPYGKVDGAGSIEGNHMVGLSARGALKLADDHGWGYEKILKYYYTGIDLETVY